MGFHGTVPLVLPRTAGQDGHVGCKRMGGSHGIPRDSPTTPTKDSVKGQTCRIQVYGMYPWDSLGHSHLSYIGQWDRTDTKDASV